MSKEKRQNEKVEETCEQSCCSECCKEAVEENVTKLETDEETSMLIEKLASEKEEYLNALKRERADFENYKKRNANLVATSYKDGVYDTAKKLLPVIDNLERAVDAAGDENDALKEGVKLVLKNLKDIFKDIGIEEIDASGQFDPNVHNAVMQVEPEEGEESGTVKEVLQKGYRMGDKVLRYSMVKVIM